MKTIQLSNPVSIKNLKMKHNIGGCTLARVCIGYNDEVYFLFSDNDSEQVSKKNAQSNSKYMMIHGIVGGCVIRRSGSRERRSGRLGQHRATRLAE